MVTRTMTRTYVTCAACGAGLDESGPGHEVWCPFPKIDEAAKTTPLDELALAALRDMARLARNGRGPNREWSTAFEAAVELGSRLLERDEKVKALEAERKWLATMGSRVFHARKDLFGRVVDRVAQPEGLPATHVLVRYEWPYDPKAEPVEVTIADLVPAYVVGG